MTLTDLDLGDLHPLDQHVWDPSSSEDSGCDLSSDDCDLFKDMPPPDWNQWRTCRLTTFPLCMTY